MQATLDLILASGSPRRKELLQAMGYDFQTCSLDVDESFSLDSIPEEAVMFLAEKKAQAYKGSDAALVIAADTLVYLQGQFLGKPKDTADAVRLLQALSGKVHEVYTGVCLRLEQNYLRFYACTQVEFRILKQAEIDYYIQHYKPMDKAGAYGIQEWIGWIGVKGIVGSYSNVMGLPTAMLQEKLETFLESQGLHVDLLNKKR